MIPIIIPIGLGAAGILAHLIKNASKPAPSVSVSGRRRGMSGTYLARLARMMRAGVRPTDRIIECAMYEAIQQGRPDVAEALSDKFFRYPDDDKDDVDDGDDEETDDKPKDTITVSGKSSPIFGVDNTSWETFVSKLATDAPTFGTEKYIGMYHQRRDRLEELGLLDAMKPDDLDTQYAALVADLVDAHGKATDVIREYLASIVTVDGEEYPVTLSGILGLLKAAGVKNAKAWLDKPNDRLAGTTNVFLATNGVF